jgi:hypothetical protein
LRNRAILLSKEAYVPLLRWRQAEYQALNRLSDETKDRIVPFIMIPPVEYDFEKMTDKKTIPEHIEPFADKYRLKWGDRPAWIGVDKEIVTELMPDGQDVLTHVFTELRKIEANAVPAIHLSSEQRVVEAAAQIAAGDKRGAGVSIQLEDLMGPRPASELASTISQLGLSAAEVDLIVDLRAPNFQPLETFSRILSSALGRCGDLSEFRNLVIASCAFPMSLKHVERGGVQIPRHDWQLYNVLLERMSDSELQLNYGDYTVVHPDFVLVDMRAIKPAGKIIYTIADSWLIHKGGAFAKNRLQMHEHSLAITSSPEFYGGDYSFGDDFIRRCALQEEGPSTLAMWKQVAINHHITVTAQQLANLYGT